MTSTIDDPTPLDGWILTSSGRRFWPLSPREVDVAIEDIAHALALLCRFTGHVRQFYSVAQHSVHVSELVHPRYALEGLLHDASEAYLCDLARPVKHHPALDYYREAEKDLQAMIYRAFGVDANEPGAVRAADNQMLMTERRDLIAASGYWTLDEDQCRMERIDPWSPELAEVRFLARFQVLRP